MKIISFAVLLGFLGLVTATPGAPGGTCDATEEVYADVGSRGPMGPCSTDKTFTVTCDVAGYTPGTPIGMKITGGGQYKGFILKADSGSFADPESKAGVCAGVDTAASHTSSALKNGATEHIWTPPAAGSGPVEFRAIVVAGKKTYITAQVTLQEGTGTGTGGTGGQGTTTAPTVKPINPVVEVIGDPMSAYTQCGWSFGEPLLEADGTPAQASWRDPGGCAKACDDREGCLFITYIKTLDEDVRTCFLQKSIAFNEDWWSCGKVGAKDESMGWMDGSGSFAAPSSFLMVVLAICALFH